MPVEQLPLFYNQRDQLKGMLDDIPFGGDQEQLADIPNL